ncbi:MAG: hypothetical protein K2N85_06575 [Lachnospiraceae bacterium]|nr:hypothetical protein [Lachnospiraceae bacterium]
MRMTNKIMRNNSLYNINQNKLLEDRLSNSMTNQSKITRPSDDPIVAIRALRLRTNVTTVSQYYDKNAQDADSWLSVTGDAMDTVGEVLKSLYSQVTDASKKSLTYSDLKIIYEQMQSLTKEFYASGNVDYAGRYVFSGFRTDTPITFTEENILEFNQDPDNRKTYVIEESFGYDDISSINYTDWENAVDLNNNKDERDVVNTTLYRFRLSYDGLNNSAANGDDVKPEDFQIYVDLADDPTAASNQISVKVYDDAETAYKAVINASKKVPDDEPIVAYIPSTGEVVFSESYFKGTTDLGPTTITEKMQVRVKYSKSDWQAGDINPVHYFHCIGTDERNKTDAMKLEAAEDALSGVQGVLKDVQDVLKDLRYGTEDSLKEADELIKAADEKLGKIKANDGDEDTKTALEAAKTALEAAVAKVNPTISGAALADARIETMSAIDSIQKAVDKAQIEVNRIRNHLVEYNPDEKDQDIYYDVGFNQKIQVNTHADEVFTHGARRDVDDFSIYLEQLRTVEDKISDIEGKMTEYAEDSDEYKSLKLKLDAANKAYTYIRDNVQTRFENQITKYQKYIDDKNVAVTNNGTRGSRLDLITSRLMNQKATFKDLQSSNEDADVSELAVQLKSSELTYEAALMATSKIMQTNLMNYI